MIIYPAIDILDQQVVRLAQGDYQRATVYNKDPVTVARQLAAQGASHLHVVDLDGARLGQSVNKTLIGQIVAATGLKVQVGGGIRQVSEAQALRECGVDRIVLGSLAVQDPATSERLIAELGPDRVVLAIDCRQLNQEYLVATQAWQETSKVSIWQLIETYRPMGLRNLLCTDIDRDGMESGSAIDLYQKIKAAYPDMQLLASGGVSSLSDLQELRAAGLTGCVIGRALYENRFSLPEALQC